MNKELLQTLKDITKAFDASGLFWGVGASVLLYSYGLENYPSDIDILVGDMDILKAKKIMDTMGIKQPEKASVFYATDYFYEYDVRNINVDIMAGFKINLSNGIFNYTFDTDSVPHRLFIGHTPIPFTTLEDWYILYQLMPDKKKKYKKIENFFFQHGIQYPGLLQKMLLNPELPENVKQNIQYLFNNQEV